ncbi:hypothetical protein VTK73DRAFT_8808 [Phialemonium thermophilum]|uniref:Uncharacterized protein n=1 Tax=Phialemonium thermophilum TaxID=223376 RepID=A0ABR3W6S1_9PEZI
MTAPPSRFVFVNVDPSHKATSDLVVRSKAGAHRQEAAVAAASTAAETSAETAASLPARRAAADAAGGASRRQAPPWTRGPRFRLENTSRAARRKKPRVSGSKAIHADSVWSDDAVRVAIARLLPVLTERVARFGASRPDPFQSLPSTGLPEELESPTLAFLLHEYQPAICNAPPSDQEVVALFDFVKHNRAAFLSNLFSALCYRQARDKKWGIVLGDKESRELAYCAFYCQYEATKLLKEEVVRYGVQMPEAAFLTMLYLGCCAWDGNHAEDRPAFVPFLESLGLLDLYTGFRPERCHVEACYKTIRARGGLGTFSLPFLAAGISYSAVLDATRMGGKPALPFVPHLDQDQPCSLDRRLGFTTADVERRLGAYRRYLPDGMLQVLYGLRAFEAVLGQYADQDVAVGSERRALVDQRNLVQFHILSLPSERCSREWEDALYETCRLALMLYGMGVVFPVSLGAAPWGRLTQELLDVLQRDDAAVLRRCGPHHPLALQLLAWSTVIGGISAHGTPLRSRYVSLLKKWWPPQMFESRFATFRSAMLESIAWFSYSCEKAGEDLWREVLQLERTDAPTRSNAGDQQT